MSCGEQPHYSDNRSIISTSFVVFRTVIRLRLAYQIATNWPAMFSSRNTQTLICSFTCKTYTSSVFVGHCLAILLYICIICRSSVAIKICAKTSLHRVMVAAYSTHGRQRISVRKSRFKTAYLILLNDNSLVVAINCSYQMLYIVCGLPHSWETICIIKTLNLLISITHFVTWYDTISGNADNVQIALLLTGEKKLNLFSTNLYAWQVLDLFRLVKTVRRND